MKCNIVFISPYGATLTFHDVEVLDHTTRDGVGVYEIFERADAEQPVGFVPTSWAVSVRQVPVVEVGEPPRPFSPTIVNPNDVTGPSC